MKIEFIGPLLVMPPGNWLTKRDSVLPSFDRLIVQITEQLDSCTFLLERDFAFEDTLSMDERKVYWQERNKASKAEECPVVPIIVSEEKGYHNKETSSSAISVYYKSNLHWKKTQDYVIHRLGCIRTDKLQYEANLSQLEQNELHLRKQLSDLSGRIYPPFPDEALHTSLFHRPGPYDLSATLTYQSLVSAIEANSSYLNQELGKYSLLKKEECHLMEKYQQLQTRMKLWILRERIRLVAYELCYGDLYKDSDVSIYIREIEKMSPVPWQTSPAQVKCYQCIDFCQCEFVNAMKFIEKKREM